MLSSFHPTLITGLTTNANSCIAQAASGLDNLKMSESPLKKINFEAVDKENMKQDIPIVDGIDLKTPSPDIVKEEVKKPAVAPTIKETEAHEPLLQENPNRFVLFPIKYHEVRVSHASRVKCFRLSRANLPRHRSGACTRKPKLLSGLPKKLISPKISMTGTTA